MTPRLLQRWWNETLPMTPSREVVADELTHVSAREVVRRTRLVRVDNDRVIAVGGDELVEIDVSRDAATWRVRPTPVLYPMRAGVTGLPLMLGNRGEVLDMQPDLSVRELEGGPIMAARRLPDRSVVYQPERRLVFGTWLVDPTGAVRWRLRSRDGLEAALDDVILMSSATEVVCRSTATGDARWTRRGAFYAIVDDAVWLVDETSLVSYGLEQGEERARIAFGMVGASLLVDPDGIGNLFSQGTYWTIELRTSRVISRFRFARSRMKDPPRHLLAELPLSDSLLVRTSEHALYKFPARDGEGLLPAPLWRSADHILAVLPHRRGLLTLTEAMDAERLVLHWLAPR